MTISRISFKLFAATFVLFIAMFFAGKIGSEIRHDEYVRLQTEKVQAAEEWTSENPGKIHFGVFGGAKTIMSAQRNLSWSMSPNLRSRFSISDEQPFNQIIAENLKYCAII
jgi:hypothetical protein